MPSLSEEIQGVAQIRLLRLIVATVDGAVIAEQHFVTRSISLVSSDHGNPGHPWGLWGGSGPCSGRSVRGVKGQVRTVFVHCLEICLIVVH